MKYTLFIAPLLLVVQFLQAQDFNITKVPDWVKPVEMPTDSELSKYDISSGYYAIIDDNQFNLANFEVFKRTVLNVLSYSGITNASQLSVTLDTSYRQLNIHYLYVWRDGKKIDRTNDLSFEIVHNEFMLNQGIYSGQITAYDILDDIRKGDLIEFAYSLNGQNPIFENENYLILPLETTNHIDLLSYKIIYPKESDYTIEFSEPDYVAYLDTIINNMHLIEIVLNDIIPIELEENIPSWEVPYSYFTLSSMKGWKEVNLWSQRVFKLQQEPDLELVFEEIFEGNESTEAKINKIINYVQDDIRYMGIESGIGSIKPFSPKQVVDQRFGDCKDKSLLLVWLLKKLGIEDAYPVLVNTFSLNELDKFLPSNQVFNHCIAKYKYQDSIYWVDPTITQQGGNYENQYTPDYGKVLVVGEVLDSLQNMSVSANKGVTDIEYIITIPSLSEPANLKITSKRNAFFADVKRSLLEYYPLESLSSYIEDDLKLVYPIVERDSEIEVIDSVESNVLTLKYNYKIDGFLEKSEEIFDVDGFSVFKYEPQILYSYFKESGCIDRDYNYALDDFNEVSFRVIIEFPQGMLIDDTYEIIEHDAYVFEKTTEQLSPKTIKLDYSYKNLAKFIKAEDYKEFCEERKKIVDGLISVFYFPN